MSASRRGGDSTPSGWYVPGGYSLSRSERRRRAREGSSRRFVAGLLGVSVVSGLALVGVEFAEALRGEEGPATYVAAAPVVLSPPSAEGGSPEPSSVSTEAPRGTEEGGGAADPGPSATSDPTGSRVGSEGGDGAYELRIPAAGVDAEVDPYTDAEVAANDGVTPPTLDRVSLWTGGSEPDASSTGTTYLYGHTFYRPAVFNDLGEVEEGSEVLVEGPGGETRYVVTGSFVVEKDDLSSDPRVTEDVAGRLVLVACYRERGDERRTSENLVVVASRAAG